LRTLGLVAVSTAIPAVGFGFVDNFLMIIAGDYIDVTIGVTLGERVAAGP
jgi:tRNA-specific adenosine deaminase 1